MKKGNKHVLLVYNYECNKQNEHKMGFIKYVLLLKLGINAKAHSMFISMKRLITYRSKRLEYAA